MEPFRLQFVAVPATDDSVSRQNVLAASAFPRAKRGQHVHPVAVCGGGQSLEAHLKELETWPGDIWAINKTADWLLDRGIDCTLYCLDPLIENSTAAKRLLSTTCDPSLFQGLVECFGLAEFEEGGIAGGSTAASRAPTLALRLGYPGAVFFGCDSSFEDRTHVDRDEKLPDALYVRADGRDWLTHPEMCMQAECLSTILREFPQVFKSKSGGLLDAMTRDPEWSVVAVSAAFKEALNDTNGDQGLYDRPYCPECGQTGSHYDDCPVGMGVQ